MSFTEKHAETLGALKEHMKNTNKTLDRVRVVLDKFDEKFDKVEESTQSAYDHAQGAHTRIDGKERDAKTRRRIFASITAGLTALWGFGRWLIGVE